MLKNEKRSPVNRKTLLFCLLMIFALGATAVFAAMAVERSGMYWVGLQGGLHEAKVENRQGFMMVDISDSCYNSGLQAEVPESDTEVVNIGIGPLPSIPSLTAEELKLYSLLTRGGGFISSEDRLSLDEDIHWREVVLEKDDTINTIAAEYGISVEDIRKANALKANANPKYAEVLYIPDSPEKIPQTLDYVNKIRKAEEDLKKRGKPIAVTAYVVQDGDSLWSISAKFNLDLDTLIGSNKLSDIHMLKLGTTLRIPNQDGIYVTVAKNDTPDKLAEKYGAYKEAIFVANGLDPKKPIIAGEEIFLPGAKLIAVVESGSGKTAARSTTARVSSANVRFRWPVAGQISSNFGWRRSPFGSRRVFHSGLDIRAPKGRGIVAAAGGRIVHAGWMGGYGYTIVISHPNGVNTLYAHCSSLVAKKGQTVKSGQLIARVGSTGRSTGNHLHFEVRVNGKPQNPLRYLR